MNNKSELRNWVKEKRKNLDIKVLSSELVLKLQESEVYKQAKNIMLFYPLKDEINLLPLMEDSTKNFYLPRIHGETLLCCPYRLGEDLCESCFKTKEPKSESVEKDFIDLIIVPALAVDKKNYRLGYGGGYYDRFLLDSSCTKIVCISKEFILETVYPEKHDIKVDFVICA